MKHRPGTLSGRIRPTRFGEMMRLYRTVRGLTLRDLSRSSGVSHSTLMRIEHGQAFDVETFMALWRWMLSEEVTP